MNDKRQVVKVNIVGDEYSIRSEESPEHTRAVAAYLDGVIKSVLDAHARLEPNKAAILAALQITDELFRERSSSREIGDALRALNAEVRRLLPPAKRGDGVEASSG